ncbi:MAG TPA: HyaD/HybD family hydrogenase maturation endopeptidase [Anaeromyxobacteraceae bacterium]|nr:HyaD/HybD family hydrogenase maturation endopeptidase [Anaeromyxobacteraceae bacterium]
MARVVVLGIGNVLNSDDGLGPFVARTVQASFDLDGDVEVMDAGTPGMDLLSLLHGAEAAVFVDAVRDSGAPGDVRRYDRENLLQASTRAAMSPHEPGLREALLSLQFRGGGPADVCLWGAIPENLELGTELSAPVRQAIPRLVEGVLAELRRLGIGARRLETPRDPDIWWERHATP